MSGRIERLEHNIQDVKSRRVASFPLERALMIAGGALAVLGLMFILLAWSGASRTPYLFEQVPYLISGAIGGLALVVLGGLLYFAYWMTRNVQATQEQADVMAQTLQRIEQMMAAGAGAAPNGPIAVPAARSNGKPYVTTAKGSMFHRPDCVVVAGKGDLKAVTGDEKDLVPCKICDPVAVSAV
jgi:hypothetical protein